MSVRASHRITFLLIATILFLDLHALRQVAAKRLKVTQSIDLEDNGASGFGVATSDVFLSFLVGEPTFSTVGWNAQGKPGVTSRIFTVLGDEGLDALLWSPEFMEALKIELQHGSILKRVIDAPLLGKVLAGKGMLMGIVIPAFSKKKIVEKAEIVSVVQDEGQEKSITDGPPAKPTPSQKMIVDKFLAVLHIPTFLDKGKDAMLRLMQASPLLREAVSPHALGLLIEGMTLQLKLTNYVGTPTIKAKMKGVSLSSDDEGRTCLTDLSAQGLQMQADTIGRTALRMGMVPTLAKEMGKEGFRYMLQKIQGDLVSFLKGGILKQAMSASILQQLLGATTMTFDVLKISPLPGLAYIAGAMQPHADVKCICEGRCPSKNSKKWGNGLDDPDGIGNAGIAFRARCPLVQGRRSSLVEDSASAYMPCCYDVNNGRSTCVSGLGSGTYEETKGLCAKLGNDWRAGQRCMPTDAIRVAQCDSTQQCVLKPDFVQLSPAPGVPAALLQRNSYSGALMSAYDWGESAASLVVRVLTGHKSDQDREVTMIVANLMRRDGFLALLQTPEMMQALSEELSKGTLLQSVMTYTKLDSLLKDTIMNVKLPLIGSKQVIVNGFTDNAGDPLRQKNVLPEPPMNRTLAADVGRAAAQLLSVAQLLPPADCSDQPADVPTCSFGDALIASLLERSFLLRQLKQNGARGLSQLLGGRKIQVHLLGVDAEIVVQSVSLNIHAVSDCADVEGGCGRECPAVQGSFGELAPEAPFITDMKRSMLRRLAETLGSPGARGLIAAMRGGLVEAMSRDGGILARIMTKEFVRALMVGAKMNAGRLIVLGTETSLLNMLGSSFDMPVCGVL